MSDHPLSPEEFRAIYSRVPRVCVDLVMLQRKPHSIQNLVLLTKRTIDPKVWHLPGGTIRHGERIEAAASRIATRELGAADTWSSIIGILEYPSHHPLGDSPIGIVCMMAAPPVIRLNDEASSFMWAGTDDLPLDTHPDQSLYIRTLMLGTYRTFR